jgi:hypothetical protein
MERKNSPREAGRHQMLMKLLLVKMERTQANFTFFLSEGNLSAENMRQPTFPPGTSHLCAAEARRVPDSPLKNVPSAWINTQNCSTHLPALAVLIF